MNPGQVFKLIVHEKHLATGVHEYMVWFDATCIATADAGQVEVYVACRLPDYYYQPHVNSGEKAMLDCAVDQIRRGAVSALQASSFGLAMIMTEFRMHPVDFQPHRFREHTRRCLERLLA
ncbi:MAG: hypothetical protein KY475_19165 [Planctomycetes bacterium]|nr:hypothetical protein [Planctomycetota bacterium]